MENLETIYPYLWIEKIKKAKSAINNNKFLCTVAAIFYAIICLFLYSCSEGVPFPVSFVQSPALLISLTIVAFFFLLILFIYLVFPVICSGLIKDTLYTKYASGNPFNPFLKNILTFTLLIGGPLYFTSFFLYAPDYLWGDAYKFWYSLPILLIISMVSSFYSINNRKKGRKIKLFSKTLFYNFILIFWALLFALVLLMIFKEQNLSLYVQHALYGGFSLGLFFLCYIITFPTAKSKMASFYVFLIFPILLFIVHIPTNIYCMGLALRAFRLGGGYKEIYYIDQSNINFFPKELIDKDGKKENGRSKTIEIQVILKDGEREFIRIKDNKKLYEINTGKVSYKEHIKQ